MFSNQQISNYLDLLKFRRAASKRDARILGYVCLFAFLATIGFGLVSGLGGREVYLVVGLNVVLGLVFVMAWVRLEIVNANIELLDNLQSGKQPKDLSG